MIAWLPFALLLLQAPPQDSSSIIGGYITDKETGAPIGRASIRLSTIDDTFTIPASTDENGRYEFEIAPGTYRGWVEAGEYRATHLPAPLGPISGIALKPGEVRNINVGLARARAISVRVVDQAGEPLARVSVTVVDADSGRRRLAGWFRTTDDRGRLRMFGLGRGRYIVCAEPGPMSRSHAAGAAKQERFVRTCHPSAATETEAIPVRLAESDIDDLEIRMRRGRSFTISGTLIDSSGEPVTGGMVFLTRFESNGSGSTPVRMHEGGRFAFENVLTGEYAIEASIGGDVRPADRRATESAFVPVRVDASDVSGLVVQMATTATVVGRVVVEEGSGPIPVRPGNAPLLVHARLSGDRLPGSGNARGGHVGDDRLFYLDRMFGRRTISVANVPPGWFVKSIRYEEEDISDMAVEIRANRDPSKLEIVLSTRGAAVSGRVFDERGEAVRGARVLLIPANPAKWLGNDLAAATASAAGEYSTGPQRAGDYLIVALRPGVPLPEIRDPERIAALTAGAERVTLTANEQRTVDLRVLSGPHP